MAIGTGLYLGCIFIGICVLIGSIKIARAKKYHANTLENMWRWDRNYKI